MARSIYHDLRDLLQPLELQVAAADASTLTTLVAASPGNTLRVYGIRHSGLSALTTVVTEWRRQPANTRVSRTTSLLNAPAIVIWAPHYMTMQSLVVDPDLAVSGSYEVFYREVPA